MPSSITVSLSRQANRQTGLQGNSSMDRTYQLSSQIYSLRNLQNHMVSQALSDLNLSYTQALLLCKLSEMPGQSATQKALREDLQIKSATISTILTRLKQNGLVQLTTDPGDSRVNLISLTPKAMALIPRLSACLDAVDHKAAAGFSQEEMAVFTALLQRMQRNLEGKEARP